MVRSAKVLHILLKTDFGFAATVDHAWKKLMRRWKKIRKPDRHREYFELTEYQDSHGHKLLHQDIRKKSTARQPQRTSFDVARGTKTNQAVASLLDDRRHSDRKTASRLILGATTPVSYGGWNDKAVAASSNGAAGLTFHLPRLNATGSG